MIRMHGGYDMFGGSMYVHMMCIFFCWLIRSKSAMAAVSPEGCYPGEATLFLYIRVSAA